MSTSHVESNGPANPYTSGFEGPEKNFEVDFVPNLGPSNGLRKLEKSDWDSILDEAKCQILSQISNRHLDAYVLSESSLFVYKSKCVIKTCGTTTLLKCLPLLLEKARAIGMEVEWIGYSRKNYTFPDDQIYPHTSFTHEVDYAKQNCTGPQGDPISGGAHVLGNLNGDHWYVYVADYIERPLTNVAEAESTLNIMMYDMDPQVANLFVRSSDPDISPKDDARAITIRSGIAALCPGAQIDDFMFDPCGYSMNAILFDSYFTIHITPESAFSYASFETNLKCKEYFSLVRNVLRVFKPNRFTLTVFADDLAINGVSNLPTRESYIPMQLPSSDNFSCNSGYKKVSNSSASFQSDYCCHMANFVMMDDGQRETEVVNQTLAVNEPETPVHEEAWVSGEPIGEDSSTDSGFSSHGASSQSREQSSSGEWISDRPKVGSDYLLPEVGEHTGARFPELDLDLLKQSDNFVPRSY